MANAVDVILKVVLALDHLKLCVDHDIPTGEGLPVEIVVLPDFVVDVDGAAITRLNQPDGDGPDILAPAEVGSRAGRVASILAHLRDIEDEGLQLNYIFKTGATGFGVIEDRLSQYLADNGLQPMRFPYRVPGKRTRYAVLGRESGHPEAGRQVLALGNDDVLRESELINHFYSPIERVCQAQGVYFATDSREQFAALADLVINGPAAPHRNCQHSSGKRHVFVDLSQLWDDDGRWVRAHLQEIMTKFRKDVRTTGTTASLTQLTLVVQNAAKNATYCKSSKLFKDLQLRDGLDSIVQYSQQGIDVYDGRQHPCPCEWDTNNPYPREAFIAGLLLFRAVNAAWDRVKDLKDYLKDSRDSDGSDWPTDILPNPYGDAGTTEWSVDEAQIFGSALARLWKAHPEESLVRDRWQLLSCHASADQPGKWNPANFDTIESKLLNPVGPDWYVGVGMLTQSLTSGGQVPGDLARRSIQKLASTISMCAPRLTRHPDNWQHETICVLEPASNATLSVQFALDALRKLAMARRQGKPTVPGDAFPLSNVDGTHYPGNLTCLLDLDGTLVQSSSLRAMCLRRAFLAMLSADERFREDRRTFPLLPSSPARDPDGQPLSTGDFLHKCVLLYDVFIYNMWQGWENRLQSHPYYAHENKQIDFRQMWNHPLAYPILIRTLMVCLQKSEKPEESISWMKLSPMDILFRAMESKTLWKPEDGRWVLNVAKEKEDKDEKTARQRWVNKLLPDWLQLPLKRPESGPSIRKEGTSPEFDNFLKGVTRTHPKTSR